MRITFLVLLMIIINKRKCFVNSSNNRIIENLKHIVDTALENDLSDNDFLIQQLSQILEEEEGFRIVNHTNQSEFETFIDGSGDFIDDEELPPFYSNMSIITVTIGTTTTDYTKYTPQTYPLCQCEKGERGEKGDAGFCPRDCGRRYDTYSRNCVGPRINLDRLAQSIRQLIIDTKKIAYRNARTIPCICSAPPPPSPPPSPIVPVPSIPNPFFVDYNIFIRLKGQKGDIGTSCSPNRIRTIQSNVRVFSTLQAAMDASCTYPDHTYVHIVNEQGRLQGVFIRVHGRLIPLRLENEHALPVPFQTLPTTLSISKPKCTVTLPCPRLHIFSLGPRARKMCNPNHPNIHCSKLSDYDDLCGRVSERYHLKGFYRAFMSTSTQSLANFFDDICMNAMIINMREQVLFDTFEEMFQGKIPKSEIFDVQGLRSPFQYWWHGSLPNGTTSRDTCLDWSRQDSSLSGLASRIPNGMNGLFDYQYLWPCSISDSNIGILCIETNCDKRNSYKH